MAQRTAAARLGLRLVGASAKKRISSGSLHSLFMRRSGSTCLAATEGMNMGSESEMELKLNKAKSVYLCFDELSRCGYVSQVVRPIRMDRYDDGGKEEKLAEAFYKSSKVNKGWNHCICLGSQIIFPYGRPKFITRRILWIDPLIRPPKFHLSSPTKTKIKSFPSNKFQISWEEIDGKIYCIGYLTQPFQVLDPENDDKWRTLDAPPFFRRKRFVEYYTLFLKGSKKILGWEMYTRNGRVFCFDATKPENGWIESPPSLGDNLPFLFLGKPLVIHHKHHPTLGAFNLILSYDPRKAPLLVSPFFISNNCDSFQSINKPFHLPELCSEYIHEFGYCCDDMDDDPVISTDYNFVHLGAQKFGLFLHKFFGNHPRPARNKGFLLLVTYEYDIITSSINKDSKPTLQIQTRLLGTRRFRYSPGPIRGKPDDTNTYKIYSTGAFLL